MNGREWERKENSKLRYKAASNDNRGFKNIKSL